jgi:hypothetical protein
MVNEAKLTAIYEEAEESGYIGYIAIAWRQHAGKNPG